MPADYPKTSGSLFLETPLFVLNDRSVVKSSLPPATVAATVENPIEETIPLPFPVGDLSRFPPLGGR